MTNVEVVKPNIVKNKVAVLATHPNEKGGVGKTTTEFQQAYRLAEQGKRVLVTDFDGQRNMSKLLLGSMDAVLEIEQNGFTSAELFRSDLKVEDIRVYRSVVHENLYILPAHKVKIASVLSAGKDAASMVVNPKKYLHQLDFDNVFIDTPPSLGVTQIAALNAVDHLFIPITIDDYSNEGLISLLTTLKSVKKNLRSTANLSGVYINFFKKPTERKGENPYKDIYEQIKRDYKGLLLDGVVPDSQSIKEARMAGRPSWVSPPNGNAATVGRKVRSLIDELNARMA